jgi:RNA polymerase sigma factor (sigma-70 family)
MHEQQDEVIIQLVLRGDQRAYAVLVERYQRFVYTLCLRILNNTQDAEEATQDVFVKAYRSLSGYNGNSKFSTWLYAIARNCCVSRTRTVQPIIKPEEHITGYADNVTQQQEQLSRKQMIHKAIAQLAVDESEIITLFYTHEQTLEEICLILNISSSNAKVRLFRARKKLKQILDKYYNGELAEYKRN